MNGSDALFERARAIARKLAEQGARDCLLVGGWVRDRLLGIRSSDIDIEVYGLSYEQILQALGDHGGHLVGKAFGVIKIGRHIDVAIPLRSGRRADAVYDPHLTFEAALSRRDYTINSMAMRFDETLIDPFGGRQDLQKHILRATSEAFDEDPLRVLRGMQLAARFDLQMDTDTALRCRRLADSYAHIPRERIWGEWHKWALAAFPSRGISVLTESGWIAHYPALAALRDTPQDPLWHPEGDVLTHTCRVLDAAAQITDRRAMPPADRVVVMLAALLHDIGKPHTTLRNAEGRWISPGHAEAGIPIAAAFLKKIHAPRDRREQILPIIKHHMMHLSLPAGTSPSPRLVRRLANRLHPATLQQWAALCEADHSGRPPLPAGNPVAEWEAQAAELQVTLSKPKPLLMGRHLQALGVAPGRQMGRMLAAAYQAQLDGEFDSLATALDWAAQRLDQKNDRREAGETP